MVNILKKYSRAAGDRTQWKKVEAMFEQFRTIPKKGAREWELWRSTSRGPIHPPFVL